MTERDRPATPPNSTDGDHIDEDDCIDLLAGLVSGEALEKVLRHVRTCPACEKRIIDAGGDWETIRAMPAPENWKVSSRPLAVSDRNNRPDVLPGPVRILRFAVPLAMAAALLLVVLSRKPGPRREELSYWIPATSEILELRGAHSADADSAFWAGIGAYEKRDVSAAMAHLEKTRTSGGLEDLRRLHLASLLVNSGRAEEALGLLKELEIDYLPAPWREDAYWMEYLALVTLERTGEAEKRLEEMAKWPGRIGDLARERRAVRDP